MTILCDPYLSCRRNVGGCCLNWNTNRKAWTRKLSPAMSSDGSPNLPIILLSVYSKIPERILWWEDEYVMKSQLPERLVPVIQRACRLGLHSDKGLQPKEATA